MSLYMKLIWKLIWFVFICAWNISPQESNLKICEFCFQLCLQLNFNLKPLKRKYNSMALLVYIILITWKSAVSWPWEISAKFQISLILPSKTSNTHSYNCNIEKIWRAYLYLCKLFRTKNYLLCFSTFDILVPANAYFQKEFHVKSTNLWEFWSHREYILLWF